MRPGSRILVTGGTGFIGSHACVALMQAGYQVVIIDNLFNSERGVADRITAIVGRSPDFVEGDLRDAVLLDRIFADFRPQAVMHFAGLKAVGESVSEPLRYWEWNVGASLTLFQTMLRHGVATLVFSSSATVYGDPESVPIGENARLAPTNPYGHTKATIERMLHDLHAADPGWRIACLRYFNPVGAHASGLIGEAPQGVPNNLMPYIAQVATGQRESLQVFGDDYPTPDGTGVRDYIHVMDLAEGHVAALAALAAMTDTAPLVVNLGTGRGISVLEMIAAFSRAAGRPVPYRIVGRRPGDIAACYADPTLARQQLGWQAQRDLAAMCRDAWNWQQRQATA